MSQTTPERRPRSSPSWFVIALVLIGLAFIVGISLIVYITGRAPDRRDEDLPEPGVRLHAPSGEQAGGPVTFGVRVHSA